MSTRIIVAQTSGASFPMPYRNLKATDVAKRSDNVRSCRSGSVKLTWSGTRRGFTGRTARSIPEHPLFWQAVQEVHRLEEIARALERSEPTLVDLDDLSGAIEARQHAINRQAKVGIAPPQH